MDAFGAGVFGLALRGLDSALFTVPGLVIGVSQGLNG